MKRFRWAVPAIFSALLFGAGGAAAQVGFGEFGYYDNYDVGYDDDYDDDWFYDFYTWGAGADPYYDSYDDYDYDTDLFDWEETGLFQ